MPIVLKSGSLNLMEPSGPVQACNEIALLLPLPISIGASDRIYSIQYCTGLSKKMDGIWNRYNLKSTGRIYTFGVLKCSEKFKVLDLP